MTLRVFRIFVSSPFSDLSEERNALQREVFPKLRVLCSQYGARFQAVDLRWGISDEAGTDQSTMRICLEEIRRCQRVTPGGPNFVVLLGNRYGWCPPPSEIPADEFELILTHLTEEQKKLLSQWYERDDNAVPPNYVLQPRTGEFTDYSIWEATERQLRDTLETAVQGLPLSSQQRSKYTASATAQEIEAGVFSDPDAYKHTLCFLRHIEGLPHDRQAQSYVDLTPAGFPDTKKNDKLEQLKADLKRQLAPDQVFEYRADWISTSITTDHIQRFCDDAYTSLAKRIEIEMVANEATDSLDEENLSHETFGRERAQFFVGRVSPLQTVRVYLKSPESSPQPDTHIAKPKQGSFIDQLVARLQPVRHAATNSAPTSSKGRPPLAIYGVGGVGKSTLIARSVQQAQQDHPNAAVIFRFVGATAGASNGRDLLASICQEIAHWYRVTDSQVPLTFKDLVPVFKERLTLARADRPLILFLDALDQLSNQDNARNLTWLPSELPAHVWLVVSTLPGECLAALESKLPAENRVELKPMSIEEGQHLLTDWLRQANRALQPEQRAAVLDAFSHCGQPLYLKLAFEEARLWRSHDRAPSLSLDTPTLVQESLFTRLESIANHGSMLVSRSLGYLAAAKNGLTEDEIIDVLSRDTIFFAEFKSRIRHTLPEDRLPFVVWSRLRSDLEPYLTERGADATSLLTFYHRQLAEAVTEKYLDQATAQERHSTLADYFQPQATNVDGVKDELYNVRKLSELPYQQTLAGRLPDVKATLSNLSFIATKAFTLTAFAVDEDYRRLLAVQEDDTFLMLQREFANILHLLNRCETLSDVSATLLNRFQQLPAPMPILQQPESSKLKPYIAARYKLPDLTNPALVRTLSGHTARVTHCAFSPDGYRILSGSWDDTLKVWDAQTGQELLTLHLLGGYPHSCRFSPDGQRIVSVAFDHTLSVWDAQSGQELLTLRDVDGDHPYDCAFSPDGQRIVSAFSGFTLKLLDAYTGQQLLKTRAPLYCGAGFVFSPDGRRFVHATHELPSSKHETNVLIVDVSTGLTLLTLRGHQDSIMCCAFSPDGKYLVSASADATLKLWDAETGKELLTLSGHQGHVRHCAFSPDGQRIISGGDDGTLKLWDAETGKELLTLSGHQGHVRHCAFSPDGQRIISGGDDGTLKLWDARTGQQILTPNGFTNSQSYAYSPDGQRLVSDTDDKTLKIWDANTGEELLVVGHTASINSRAYSPDGRYIVSASDDDTLKIWDTNTTQRHPTPRNYITSIDFCTFSPDGQLLISTTPNTRPLPNNRRLEVKENSLLKVWDAYSGQELLTLREIPNAHCRACSPDGKYIVTATENSFSDDNSLIVRDAKTDQEFLTLSGHSEHVTCCVYSPDGRYIASTSQDHTMKVWNARTGEEVFTFQHDTLVHCCAFSPDGLRIVSGDYHGSLKVWDAQTGQELLILRLDQNVHYCAFSPTGDIIAAATHTSQLKVWNSHNGQEIFNLRDPDHASDRAYSPDQQRFVCAAPLTIPEYSWERGDPKLLKVCDANTGHELLTLRGHTETVNCYAYSWDGLQIVSGAYDGTLKIWNAVSGQELLTLQGHADTVDCCAFSPDGHHIISVSNIDRTLKVWDVSTQICKTTFYADEALFSCAFHPDGEQLAVGGAAGLYWLKIVW